VVQFIKNISKQVIAFVCGQYLILFFILAIGIKLYFFNTYVTKVAWPQYDYEYNFGIVFGFLSAALIFSPLYFLKKHKNIVAIILALIVSVLILVDTVYFSYFSALPTIGLLNTIGQTADIGPAVSGLLHWWMILFFIDVIIALIFIKPLNSAVAKIKDKYNLKKSGLKCALLAFSITVIAFGIGLLSLGFNKMDDFINRGYDIKTVSQSVGILIAHTVDIIRFVEQETTHLSSEQMKTLTDWVKANKPSQETNALTGIAKGKNVIMIQVESLGGFVINQKINDKEITPNLNKLALSSRYFPNEYFLYGGGHTSDTDFVANASYFPLDNEAVFVRYGYDNFTSLPKTLIANNYSAYAYHGFNRNFWNRDVAFKSLGYEKFYAANNYPAGKKINMGLNDGDFLSKTADYIKDQPKPSLSYVITLSSHVPFAISDETKELGVNINDFPDQVGGYLENINYVDRMLEKFFDKLKSEKLYDDSLILVYGDHTPVLPAFTAGTIKYDPGTVQQKEVPLFIKLPKETVGKTYKNQGAHLDIMPTVLDLLGIKTSQLMFGQSLFAENSKEFQICPNQLPAFTSLGNCDDAISAEKEKSQQIIHYNLFNKLKE